MKIKDFFMYQSKPEDTSAIKTKGVLKNLYKGVKIKWFAIIVGAILSVLSNLVIFAVYDEYMAIFYGTLDSLAPMWKYLAVSMLQYFIMFATIISDLALVSVVTGVRRKMWRKMVRLPLKDYDEASPNGMLSRITSDAEYSAMPFTVAIVILQLIFSVNALFAVCPTGLPTALPFAIIAIIAALLTVIYSIRVASRAAVFMQERISELTGHYAEQLGNIRFVKASGAEEETIRKTDRLIDERYRAALYGAFGKMLNALSGRFVHIIAYAACCLGGIVAIRHQAIQSTAPIQELYAYTTAMEVALTYLLTIPTTFATAIGGTKKLSALLKGKEEETESGKELEGVQGDLCLIEGSFAYGEEDTIHGVSVAIPYGKTTAIVGPNGSGKSTLIKLIDRLYPLGSGDLMMGEEKAEDVSLKSWRKQFGIVTQKARLFNGTIRDNICYGSEGVEEKDILRAVKMAQLEDLVKERGLEYNIGVRGSKLSGGEQQRVAIARALIKDPAYLILDEATANLDTKTEQEVKQGMQELMKGRTILMIAHNYSAISDADKVIVLKKGELEDSGSVSEVSGRSQFIRSMQKV